MPQCSPAKDDLGSGFRVSSQFSGIDLAESLAHFVDQPEHCAEKRYRGNESFQYATPITLLDKPGLIRESPNRKGRAKKTRMSEEATVFRGSPSVVTRFGPLFLAFLVLLAGAAVMIAFRQQPAAMIGGGLVAGLAFLFILVTIALVKATHYEITSERIRIRRGIFTKRTDEVELYRANDTSLVEPLSLRMLGLGTIEIRTNDVTTPTVYLHAIHGARGVRENLRKYIEECRDRKRVRITELEEPHPGGQT